MSLFLKKSFINELQELADKRELTYWNWTKSSRCQILPKYILHSGKISLTVRPLQPGNTKGGSITVPLTSCLTGFELAL
jgi:hypothetical protein